MKKLLIITCLFISSNLFAQKDSVKYHPVSLYLNRAQNQAYIGGMCFLVGGFAWGANQCEFFGDDPDMIKVYNVAGVAAMTTGVIFEVLAIENLINAQRSKNSLSLKASPTGFSLAFKF